MLLECCGTLRCFTVPHVPVPTHPPTHYPTTTLSVFSLHDTTIKHVLDCSKTFSLSTQYTLMLQFILHSFCPKQLKNRIPKTPHYTPFFASVPATSLDLCHPLPMPSLLHRFLRMHSRASPPPCTRRKEASASASAAATALPVACRSVAGSLSLYLLGKTKPAA